MSSNKSWVTLATNDSYSLGALVLAHSLKNVKTAHKLAILITPGVTPSMKQQIEAVFDDVKVVDVLDSKDQTHLALMCRPELGVTFTKLHCWTLTKYEKCVFLDADTLVLQNCDELFEREELSAAPDPGWPDCFNSGVFVYKPSQDTFSQLLEFARTRGSFDGGDQGLLNMFFKDWAHTDISKHLSFTYNVVWSSTYSYLPALKQFGQNMKIIHFISSSKPWLQSFNTETKLVTAISGGTGLQALLQFWWDLFCHHVHPKLSSEMIESRLSSRYSYDFHYKDPLNNSSNYFSSNTYIPNSYTPNNSLFHEYYTPTYEPPKEEHYSFIDPWEQFSTEQTRCNVEEEKIHEYQIENVRDEPTMVEECLGSNCKQEIENHYYCINNDHTYKEDQTTDYSFQNYLIEEVNTYCDEAKNNTFIEKIKTCNESQQAQGPIKYENCPACSDDIPINPNSDLSVNNFRPDSPTHCEISKDQPCDVDGGLAGQFARISLGEKSADQTALEDFLRRQSWEQGNIDYLGRDSFTNIWAKINETLGTTTEVSIDPSVVKTPSSLEVVHTEEPKPLKSVLKKTSTTTPPVESELSEKSEQPEKQLEKLDLSKNISGAPDTPTVTAPTPPIVSATQVQDSPKPESVELENQPPKPEVVQLKEEISKSDLGTIVQIKSIEQEPSKTELIDPVKVASISETSAKESSDPVKLEQILLESVPKPDEPVTEVTQSTETAQIPQPSADSSTPVPSNEPPVAPKRTNKGSPSAPKNIQPSDK